MKTQSILASVILIGASVMVLPSFAGTSENADGCYWENMGGDYQWTCHPQYSFRNRGEFMRPKFKSSE